LLLPGTIYVLFFIKKEANSEQTLIWIPRLHLRRNLKKPAIININLGTPHVEKFLFLSTKVNKA
jgi:hypothetical protein